jgi:sec-independent protein translocase protein TatC
LLPGLYKNERSAFLPFLVASPLLFLLGAALVYFFFTPMVMWFFLSMEQTGGEVKPRSCTLPKVSEYLGLIMTLIFAFGLVFQLPVVTTLVGPRRPGATSEGLAKQTQIRHRGRIRRGCDPDAARSGDPDRACAAHHHSLRNAIYCARLVERQRAAAEG